MLTVKHKILAVCPISLRLCLLLCVMVALFAPPSRPALARQGAAPAADSSWSVTGNLDTERFRHTATQLANGKVLVVGGLDNNFTPTKKVEIYDPATKTWSIAAELSV